MKTLVSLIVSLTITLVLPVSIFAQDNPQNPYTHPTNCPVLVYHHLTENEQATGPWATTPAKFVQDMKTLKDNGYTPIFTYELQNAMNGTAKLPDKPIIIHFDDGYTSVYEYALPVLKKYNFKAETYIITDFTKEDPLVSGYDTYLSWPQLREMEKSGLMHIYLHGKTHDPITGLSLEQAAQDYKNAQGLISLNLGPRHSYYVYPSGQYNANTLKTITESGCEMQYVWAWQVKPQIKKYNVLVRVNVGRQDTVLNAIKTYQSLYNILLH